MIFTTKSTPPHLKIVFINNLSVIYSHLDSFVYTTTRI